MKASTKQVMLILHIISWIIFIGICIKTGAMLVSAFVSLVINPEATKKLYMELNLWDLYNYSLRHYVSVLSMIIFLWCLKAYMFYQVIRIFLKINFVHPFSKEISSLVSSIGNVALQIGIGTLVTLGYCKWLMKKGVGFPNMGDFLGGAPEFLLLGGVIFIIAQVFKKGIEIQAENELTI